MSGSPPGRSHVYKIVSRDEACPKLNGISVRGVVDSPLPSLDAIVADDDIVVVDVLEKGATARWMAALRCKKKQAALWVAIMFVWISDFDWMDDDVRCGLCTGTVYMHTVYFLTVMRSDDE